jgi:hypothetical protein
MDKGKSPSAEEIALTWISYDLCRVICGAHLMRLCRCPNPPALHRARIESTPAQPLLGMYLLDTIGPVADRNVST